MDASNDCENRESCDSCPHKHTILCPIQLEKLKKDLEDIRQVRYLVEEYDTKLRGSKWVK